MSAHLLIDVVEKLYKLHKSLYELAVKKTEIIKTGDIDSLNSIMKDEQAHISAIKKLEAERQKATKQLCGKKENPTVTDCIDILNGKEKEDLLSVCERLTSLLFEIKEINHLNQQLLHYSLQFVNVSLNLLRPQPPAINYGPPTKQKSDSQNLNGIFNSQA